MFEHLPAPRLILSTDNEKLFRDKLRVEREQFHAAAENVLLHSSKLLKEADDIITRIMRARVSAQ